MNETELIELLDADLLQKFKDIKTMLSGRDLKLRVVPSNYEDETHVFYFEIFSENHDVSIFYDKEFSVVDDGLHDDLSTEFAVTFYELFNAIKLMSFVIKSFDCVSKKKWINFTNMTLSSEISNQIRITGDINDTHYCKIGECSFISDSETKGVCMDLYIGGLEVVTYSLDLNGIHKDVNLEILPRGERVSFNNYSLSTFEFDIDIVVRKHFNDLREDNIRKARNIVKNYVNVYKMILQQ